MKRYNRKGEVDSDTVVAIAFFIITAFIVSGSFYLYNRDADRAFELKKLELQNRQTTSQPTTQETTK